MSNPPLPWRFIAVNLPDPFTARTTIALQSAKTSQEEDC